MKDRASQLDAVLSYPTGIYVVHLNVIRVAAKYARDYNITPYNGVSIAVEHNVRDIISADKET